MTEFNFSIHKGSTSPSSIIHLNSDFPLLGKGAFAIWKMLDKIPISKSSLISFFLPNNLGTL